MPCDSTQAAKCNAVQGDASSNSVCRQHTRSTCSADIMALYDMMELSNLGMYRAPQCLALLSESNEASLNAVDDGWSRA